ncbi:hypothetical protein [Bacillus sp. FJAT-22090]|uniref:hypothetical protein n=1 Tax=Bacillus sp. FJAT-22090 TaxID=1581038 RepID=UPI0011A2E79F|nr:hypothetical protein [Bacillus sp. FJAT-22090]
MKDPTLKKVAYGLAMAIAIILVHFIDVHIYSMPAMFALFLAIFITYLGIKIVNKSARFDKKITRTTYNLLNVLVVFVLFIAYYTIAQ